VYFDWQLPFAAKIMAHEISHYSAFQDQDAILLQGN
jgi:predicted SprT family Zn-dependent metalloprotease